MPGVSEILRREIARGRMEGMDTPQIAHTPDRQSYTLTLDGAEIG